MTIPRQSGTFEDRMMGKALALSDERSDYEGRVQAMALLVGGVSPPDIVAGMRLRARELDFLADVREVLYRRERRLAAYL